MQPSAPCQDNDRHDRAGGRRLPRDVRHDRRTCGRPRQQRGRQGRLVDPSVACHFACDPAKDKPIHSTSARPPKEDADTQTRPKQAQHAQGRPFPARSAVRQELRCQGQRRHLRRQERGRSAAPAHRAGSPAIHLRRIRREQHPLRSIESAAAGPRHLRRLADGGRLQQQQRQGYCPDRDPAEHRRRLQDHRHRTHPRLLHAASEEQQIHPLRVRRRRRQQQVQRRVRPQPADAVLRG